MTANTARVSEQETIMKLRDGSPVEIIKPFGDCRFEVLTQVTLKDPGVSGNPIKMIKENTIALFEAVI